MLRSWWVFLENGVTFLFCVEDDLIQKLTKMARLKYYHVNSRRKDAVTMCRFFHHWNQMTFSSIFSTFSSTFLLIVNLLAPIFFSTNNLTQGEIEKKKERKKERLHMLGIIIIKINSKALKCKLRHNNEEFWRNNNSLEKVWGIPWRQFLRKLTFHWFFISLWENSAPVSILLNTIHILKNIKVLLIVHLYHR